MMWELDERMNDVVLGFWVDRKRSLKIRTTIGFTGHQIMKKVFYIIDIENCSWHSCFEVPANIAFLCDVGL